MKAYYNKKEFGGNLIIEIFDERLEIKTQDPELLPILEWNKWTKLWVKSNCVNDKVIIIAGKDSYIKSNHMFNFIGSGGELEIKVWQGGGIIKGFGEIKYKGLKEVSVQECKMVEKLEKDSYVHFNSILEDFLATEIEMYKSRGESCKKDVEEVNEIISEYKNYEQIELESYYEDMSFLD
jgi:N-acetylglucosamine-6-phosphate deacetylase